MEREYWHTRLELAKATSAPFGAGAYLEGNILLIGEQASDPTSAPEQEPFCSSKGCSGWINKVLAAEGVPEEKLFWVNALYNNGTPVDLIELVQELKPSSVVALGGVAKRQCERQSVPNFLFTYHPQYWKRFRSKERYPLLDLLKFLLIAVPDRQINFLSGNFEIGYK